MMTEELKITQKDMRLLLSAASPEERHGGKGPYPFPHSISFLIN